MCLALPARVTFTRKSTADVEVNGVKRSVSIVLTPEIKNGDYVLVHAGFAIAAVDEQEALKTLELVHGVLNRSDEHENA
ncbi:MAG: HypC/HybG/HupF family hydrogenase formation chaperone [Desulfobacterales bacterium]